MPRSATLVATAVAGLLASTVGATAAPGPTPGAAGIGDRLHPGLGNGGYVVRRLGIDLHLTRGLRRYRATSTVEARATQDLSRLNLDSATGKVLRVTVDGRSAAWRRTGEELEITPRRPIAAGRSFVVRATVRGAIRTPGDDDPIRLGLLRSENWVFTRLMPGGAHRVVPLADHPRQKAPTVITITTPRGIRGIANGRSAGTRRVGTATRSRFVSREPVMPATLQLGAGPLRIVRGLGAEHSRLRLAVPRTARPAAVADLRDQLRRSMTFLRRHLGPEPTPRYGAFVPPRSPPAIESQGVTLLSAEVLPRRGRMADEERETITHELTHEWFGNAVSVADWSDLWLSEGHASYWQLRWRSARTGRSMAELLAERRENASAVLAEQGPLAAPRPEAFPPRRAPYGPGVYGVGPLVLDALQREVGEETFGRIERAWVDEHRGGTAGSDDFRALAARVGGRDLSAFFAGWLDGTTIPTEVARR